jgi:hypothetical protein
MFSSESTGEWSSPFAAIPDENDPPHRAQAPQAASRRLRWAGCAVLLIGGLAVGCSAGRLVPRYTAAGRPPATSAPVPPPPAGPLVHVPRPDYSDPASVATAFYIAWAATDAVHDGPDAYAARCAPLVTAPLEAQLAGSQPATAGWQAMRSEHLISLGRVQAVTHPDGAPSPTPLVVYLRVYAIRVTITTVGRTTRSDGITLQLTRSRGRWLVSRVLFY